MSPPWIVGLGALNLDRIFLVPEILSGEGEVGITAFLQSPGGSAANTIYALAKIGVPTGFVGAVGDDRWGELVLRSLRRVGVELRTVSKRGLPTGEVLALVDRTGKRVLYVLPGANDRLELTDLDLDFIGRARWLHLSSFIGDAQFELQKRLLALIPDGVRVSLAAGMLYASRGLAALSPILGRVDILFLNQAELQKLTGQGIPGGVHICHKAGVGMVVVTLGGEREGVCYISDGKASFLVPRRYRAYRVRDTTGAGDAFAAGFLYGIFKGEPAERCAVYGEILAAFSLARHGARAGLPSRRKFERACLKYCS